MSAAGLCYVRAPSCLSEGVFTKFASQWITDPYMLEGP